MHALRWGRDVTSLEAVADEVLGTRTAAAAEALRPRERGW